MTTSRKSRQRDAIIENLLSRYDHPTAEDVYLSLKPAMPNISLATVYRNLNTLSDDGVINSIIASDAVHYDAHLQAHRHFICKNCGKIFDIDFDIDSSIMDCANEKFDGVIDSCKLIFYGFCKSCNQI